MILTNPAALALLALAVPIVLMYVLKLRRREYAVSSTVLWRRAVDDVQANAPWQRLRPSLLLLLQLLAVLALVLALVQPATTSARTFGGDLIVIVDQSYGMQVHDVAPSRFAVALLRAHALARTLTGSNVISVIGMAAEPHLAIAESADAGAVAAAIDGLRGGVSAPNFPAALSEAASLARNGTQTRVVVLTSRQSGIAALPFSTPFPVQIVRIGGPLRDLGIAAFRASRVGGHVEAVARIDNFGVAAVSSDLQLIVNGQLADVRPLAVEAGHETTQFWADLPATATRLVLRLMRPDDVTLDKAAYAVVPPPVVRRVLLVSQGDYFVQTALTLTPDVHVTVVAPEKFTSAPTADLVVFDGFLPPALPAAPALFLSPPAGAVGGLRFGAYHPTGVAGLTALAPGGGLGAVLQYVDLSDVHIARVRAVGVPAWMQPLATTAGRPVMLAGENGPQRVAALPFPLQESDWPLRVSFPVAMTNLLHWLAPGLTLGQDNVTAGGTLSIFPPPGTTQIAVVRPDGAVDPVRTPLAVYRVPVQPGIYWARAGTVQAPFAANFFPARTAAATGPGEFWLGTGRPSTSDRVAIPMPLGWVFAVMALGVLSTEWWSAYRR